MAIRNLDKIFRPRQVAVIAGGDNDPISATVLENLTSSKYAGDVYAVGGQGSRGVARYPNVAGLPVAVDLAVVCSTPTEVPQVIRQCGRRGVGAVLVTTGGFREAGPAGLELQRQILHESAQFDGLRILGPRSIGVLVPDLHLNAGLASAHPKPGSIAFISQSGTMCTSALDLAIDDEIGFSHFVSIGDSLEVTVGDLIDYFAADQRTESIILFLDSISHARQFMSAARAIANKKPIVIYKAGRFSELTESSLSYAGALASVDAVYEAAFERAGVVPRCRDRRHVRLCSATGPLHNAYRTTAGDHHQCRWTWSGRRRQSGQLSR